MAGFGFDAGQFMAGGKKGGKIQATKVFEKVI